ncbi:hypothetical protein ID871_11465 [Streptomyces pratensis]|nr:hypothetical protein [Streptomyces pratensis]
MAENTKPADDNNDETPEVEAHSVLDLQETSVDREIEAPGSCVSVISVVMGADRTHCGGATEAEAVLPPWRPVGR